MTTYQRKGGTYRRNGKTYRRKGGTVHTRRSPRRQGVGVEELAQSIQRGRVLLKGYKQQADAPLWSRLFRRRPPAAPSWEETSETDKAGFRESARRLLDAGGTPAGWEKAYDEVNRRGR